MEGKEGHGRKSDAVFALIDWEKSQKKLSLDDNLDRNRNLPNTNHVCTSKPLRSILLTHGCAKVAHCVTARWRNFSHYCRPRRQYDVWVTCSEHRETLTAAPTSHGVHKQALTVQGWSTQFATKQVGRVRYVTAVDGGLKRFSLVAWFAHPYSNL